MVSDNAREPEAIMPSLHGVSKMILLRFAVSVHPRQKLPRVRKIKLPYWLCCIALNAAEYRRRLPPLPYLIRHRHARMFLGKPCDIP